MSAPAPKMARSYRRVVLSVVREPSEPYQVRSGADIAPLVRSVIGDDPREHFVAVYLDSKHKPVAVHVVSVGSVDSCSVNPREVYGPALQLAATAIAVAHNHPSGDPTPSPEDRAVTKRLMDAGELLGVQLLDHIVIGSARYYSFTSEGFYAL